ncbi:MAG: metallophosphoesterase [Actinobacteria bacterium]|nr:metallophosphoesterase [Actinomycetota bacterium]
MRLRIAAAGDIHCSEEERTRLENAFMDAERENDLILLAGDLTTSGEPEQAAVLADVTRGIGVPIYAVLGNHDWHANRHEELVSTLRGGGIRILERAHEILTVEGIEIGIVGTKGFVGGFSGSLMPDFGEPLLRRVYAETSAEVSALDRGLRKICECAVRIVLLHYAPTTTTIEGERETIWAFLGSERLAGPIAEHSPDLVLHGHGHGGTFAGSIEDIPVFNVGVPVTGRDFWIFEFDSEAGLVTEPDEALRSKER